MINALIPIKIKSDQQFELMISCISSYKNFLPDQIRIKVANESSKNYTNKIIDFFDSIGYQYDLIQSSGYFDSISKLIQSIDAKYHFFIVDDVELITKKDIISPCIESFEKINDLLQIKIGGGKIARKSKIKNIETYSHKYECVHLSTNDQVWVGKIIDDDEEWIITQWNSVHRSEIFQKINAEIIKNKITFNTWDQFNMFIKNNYMNTIGHLKTGWLNFEDYLYPWYRSDISLKDSKNLLEIK